MKHNKPYSVPTVREIKIGKNNIVCASDSTGIQKDGNNSVTSVGICGENYNSDSDDIF